MWHENSATDRMDMMDVAAVWPSMAQFAPVPIPEPSPGSAGIGGIVALACAVLIGTCAAVV